MKSLVLLTALAAGNAAAAGGFNLPVAEAAPSAAAPVLQSGTDWTGPHAGLQFGQAEADIGLPDGFEPSGIDVDGRRYGLHAGYLRDFGPFVGGVELSYDKLDDFEVAEVELDDLGADIEGSLLRAS